MTQTGADRLVVGLGSALGFVVGGFVGGVVGMTVTRDKNDLAPDGLPWSDPSEDQIAASELLGAVGAFVGAAVGAMIATPSAEKDLPPRTGVSGPLLPRFP